jgi:hypothetical protein
MNESRVFFAIARVGESDDVKIAKARRQFGEGSNLDANMVIAKTLALVFTTCF